MSKISEKNGKISGDNIFPEKEHPWSEDNTLAIAHNECTTFDETETKEHVEVDHHFICYIHKDGKLYEIG